MACRSIPSSSTAWRQDPALNQPDGIHPNPKGVDVIVERILPFVTKNLDDFAASAHAPPVRRPARP